MGEKELVKEAHDLVRQHLEKKNYYVLSSPRKEYEAAGEGNVRMYLEMAKRVKEMK
jgi:hypothetical protein